MQHKYNFTTLARALWSGVCAVQHIKGYINNMDGHQKWRVQRVEKALATLWWKFMVIQIPVESNLLETFQAYVILWHDCASLTF
jgi:hypothetical protein